MQRGLQVPSTVRKIARLAEFAHEEPCEVSYANTSLLSVEYKEEDAVFGYATPITETTFTVNLNGVEVAFFQGTDAEVESLLKWLEGIEKVAVKTFGRKAVNRSGGKVLN